MIKLLAMIPAGAAWLCKVLGWAVTIAAGICAFCGWLVLIAALALVVGVVTILIGCALDKAAKAMHRAHHRRRWYKAYHEAMSAPAARPAEVVDLAAYRNAHNGGAA